MNQTFYEDAFTDEQKNMIQKRNLETTGGNVQDKVFLLSDVGANTYFSFDDDRISADKSDWYLRTVNSVLLEVLNYYKPIAMMVTYDGKVYQND